MDGEQERRGVVLGAAGRRRTVPRAGERSAVVAVAALVAAAVVGVAWLAPGGLGGPPAVARATDVDDAVAATGVVLDTWWAGELAALDLGWAPIGGRLTDGDGTVDCDGTPLVLDEDLRENALATWCAEGIAVAFDPDRFAADVVATQVVLAHEWGHAVQMLNPGVDLPSIDPASSPAERELQADCFAGAWAAEHVVGEFHGLMLASIGGFGDPSWVAVDDERGHGTPAERTTAYETGAARGVAACLPPAFDPR